MTLLPGGYAYQLMAAERERDEQLARRSRAARLAMECCRASIGLFSRLARAVGLRQSQPASCGCS